MLTNDVPPFLIEWGVLNLSRPKVLQMPADPQMNQQKASR